MNDRATNHGANDKGCGGSCGCASTRESADERSRREFLARATTVSLGMMSLTVLPGCSTDAAAESAGAGGAAGAGVAAGAGGSASPRVGSRPPVYGFLVDSTKCIGAGKCMTACREENDVPEGYHRTWVERYVHFKDGTVQVDHVPETGFAGAGLPAIDSEKVEKAYFVPKLCNQCDDAPCNQVCPTHASVTSPEGVELVDPELCIGCSYCVQACPYGVRFINPKTEVADKCNWCYHRITRDEQPACVEACPVDARAFGRLDDPNSEIRKRIAKVPSRVLKQHLGTHPKLRHIGIFDEVI